MADEKDKNEILQEEKKGFWAKMKYELTKPIEFGRKKEAAEEPVEEAAETVVEEITAETTEAVEESEEVIVAETVETAVDDHVEAVSETISEIEETIPENEETVLEEDPKTDEETEEKPQKQGFFAKIKSGLSKTRNNIMSGIENVLKAFTTIDEELYEELEEDEFEFIVDCLENYQEVFVIDGRNPEKLHPVFRRSGSRPDGGFRHDGLRLVPV